MTARDRSEVPSRQWALAVLACVAVAACVGVVAFALPVSILAALLVAAASLVFLLGARRFVHTAGLPAFPDPTSRDSDCRSAVGDLRVARYLYYLGMLTIGQTAFRPLGGFTTSDWLFLGSLCAVLVSAGIRRSKLAFELPPLVLVGAVLYVISGLVASIGADLPLLSLSLLGRFAYLILVWFWLGTAVLKTRRELRMAIGLVVVSVALDGVAAILQARGVAPPFVGAVAGGRMSGLAESVNGLGGAAAIAMAPAFSLAATATGALRRMVWIVAILLLVIAIVLSGSVTGMVAGVAATGVWILVSHKSARTLVIALAALSLAAGVAQVQGGSGLPTPLERLLSTTGQSEGGRYSTVATRMQGYEAAWSALGDGGWVGHGVLIGQYGADDARSVHNLVLRAWYEAGWAGGVGMALVLFGGLAYSLIAARRARTEELRHLAVGMFGGMVAFAIFAMSNPLLSQRYGWVPLALVIASLSITRRATGESVAQRRVDVESMPAVGR
jgi:hypothetical protein